MAIRMELRYRIGYSSSPNNSAISLRPSEIALTLEVARIVAERGSLNSSDISPKYCPTVMVRMSPTPS